MASQIIDRSRPATASRLAVSGKRRSILLRGFGIATMVLFLGYGLRHLDIDLLVSSLAQINLRSATWSLLLMSSILALKTFQWSLYVSLHKEIPRRRLFRLASWRLLIENLMPMGSADVATTHLLTRQEKLTASEALSLISAEQFAEFSSALILFALVSFFPSTPPWVKHAIRWVMIATAAGIPLLLFILCRYGRTAESCFLSRWIHHLRKTRRIIGRAVVLSIAVKVVEAVALLFLQQAFALAVPFWTPLLVIAALNLTLLLPVVPGNLGLFEGTVFVIYRSLDVAPHLALALGLVYHAIFILPSLVAGLTLLFSKPS